VATALEAYDIRWIQNQTEDLAQYNDKLTPNYYIVSVDEKDKLFVKQDLEAL
jgi:hypothetical protein